MPQSLHRVFLSIDGLPATVAVNENVSKDSFAHNASASVGADYQTVDDTDIAIYSDLKVFEVFGAIGWRRPRRTELDMLCFG